MKYIDSKSYRLEIGNINDSSFADLLAEKYSDAKKIIVVDENTHEHCLDYLITNFEALSKAEVILLPAGEEFKQLDILQNVWEALTEYGVSRHDLVINLGGGMITDLGGFMASCYKRGCAFINIPTSLLAMVDASIGGKTGVNLGHFKNQIGVFSNPVAVYIDPNFLSTLPDEELLSGYAEMLKHGLIHNADLFQEVVMAMKNSEVPNIELLEACILVKHAIVSEDPKEIGVRKILNFGHTIGHVIEGHFMEKGPLTHGHCVALGMVMESYIAQRRGLLSDEAFNEIQEVIFRFYPLPLYSNDEISEMVEMLYNDKKNEGGKIKTSLLTKIGVCVYDIDVPESQFVEVFLHYKNLQINMN